MQDDYLQTKAELRTDLQTKKKKKVRWWQIAIDAVLLVAFCCVVVVSANVIYLTNTYGDAFFVDGVSMYPTLNRDGLDRQADGSYKQLTWKSGDQGEGDLVDYGWAKMGEKGFSDLHRFDIVITYYPSDGIYDASTNTFTPNSTASLKIKRLIAFPGETISVTPDKPSEDSDELLTPWGTTHIKKVDGSEQDYPSFYSWEDFPDVDGDSYYYPASRFASVNEVTLPANTYFVMGDNRRGNYSSDSRSIGPIPGACIKGKAYLVTSLRRLKKNSSGSFVPTFELNYVRPAWNYLHLDDSVPAFAKESQDEQS